MIDENGRRTAYSYDALGNVSAVSYPDGTTEIFTYDANGNLTAVTAPDGSVTRMEYDARSRLVKETDSYGMAMLYGYDNANRLTSVTDGEGNTTTYEYDNLGELIAVTDVNGAVITYEYDSLGRRISETDGMGRLHTWEYDTAGNLAAEVSAAGIRTCYTYDAQDFLIRTVRYPAGWEDGSTEPTETTVYTRDSAGRLTAVTNVDGTVHYVYDGLGRLISVTDCSGDTLSYTYDEYGRKSSVTARGEDEGYGSTVYEYDKYGRMTKVSDSYGNTIVYFYNVDGTLNRESRNNGLTTVYEYDVCGFVKKIKTIDAAEHCVTEYNYVTGTNGEVLEIHETAVNAEGEQEETTTLYGYDSLNRLVSEMIQNSAGAVTFSYGYDAVSNRVSQTVRFEGDVERLLDSEAKEELREGSITYTYNERNQLVKEQLETTDGNVHVKEYVYDGDGNLLQEISEDQVQWYGYDLSGHMVSAVVETAEGKAEETYGYDWEGARIRKQAEGVISCYVNDKSGSYMQVLVEKKVSDGRNTEDGKPEDSNENIVYYTRGRQLVCRSEVVEPERDATGDVRWYLYDGHGNVRNLADQSGGMTDSYSYNAYGIRLVKSGDTENMYYYCGEQMDEATGLYYLRARYMNPLTATFTQRDSYEGELESPLTQNRYLYAGGNPVMYSDPGGNELTIQGMLTSVEGLAIISAVMVVSYHNLFASNLQMKAQMYVLEMNGLTNRFVNKFVSEIEKKDVWGPIVVPGIVYNLIIDLVPPEIQKVLVTGIPKKDEEYGACIELGPQAVSRYFWEIINQVKEKKENKRGVGGKGWRGDKVWKKNVKKVEEGGTIKELDGGIPSEEETIALINESGGIVLRIEEAHPYPNPHNFRHINYTTFFGGKGTIQIK